MADIVYGVTDAGFIKKTLDIIQTERQQALRDALGNYINLLPASVFGNLVGIGAEREASVWDLAEDTYNSRNPDMATGQALDVVLALRGQQRKGAAKSSVAAGGFILFGTAGKLIPAGTQFSVVNNPTSSFQTTADVTLVAGADEVQEIIFSAVPTVGAWIIKYGSLSTGNIAYNAQASDVQAALVAIGLTGVVVTGSFSAGFIVTFSGVNGKQDQPVLVIGTNTTGTTITVVTLTSGVIQGTAALLATSTGALQAPAGTLTNIDTPVSGLSSAINLVDATVGNAIEGDADARTRSQSALQISTSGTLAAIVDQLLELTGVSNVVPFENNTNITDGAGRPAKSYEMVVNGGDTQTITQAIWDTKAFGMQTDGGISGTAIDIQGVGHVVNWSRPTAVPIFASFDITVNSKFPSGGIQALQAAILAYGQALGIGASVIVYPDLISVFHQIPGIVGIKTRIGTAAVSTTPGAAAVDSNIAIASNQISVWSLTNINVNQL